MTVMARCPASNDQLDPESDGRCPECGVGVEATETGAIPSHQIQVARRHKGKHRRATP